MDIEEVVAQVPPEVKRIILQNKLDRWNNTVYEAQMEAAVGAGTKDEAYLKRAQAKMKDALKKVKAYQELLDELPEEARDEPIA